jgi:hypothetical protein
MDLGYWLQDFAEVSGRVSHVKYRIERASSLHAKLASIISCIIDVKWLIELIRSLPHVRGLHLALRLQCSLRLSQEYLLLIVHNFVIVR